MRIDISREFPPDVLRAFRDFLSVCRAPLERATGQSLAGYTQTIHAMTPGEIREELKAPEGGGAGYYDPGTGRLAVAPDLTPWRSVEVLCEEMIHSLRPELPESIVRGELVGEVLRHATGYGRLPRRPGPP